MDHPVKLLSVVQTMLLGHGYNANAGNYLSPKRENGIPPLASMTMRGDGLM
jgi:hypothetical protein